MIIKYDIEIDNEVILKDIQRLTNLIFKLLPRREENKEWKVTLENLILEVKGLKNLLQFYPLDFLLLLSKMEALLTLDNEGDFLLFRRTIFECLNVLSKIQKNLRGEV